MKYLILSNSNYMSAWTSPTKMQIELDNFMIWFFIKKFPRASPGTAFMDILSIDWIKQCLLYNSLNAFLPLAVVSIQVFAEEVWKHMSLSFKEGQS